MTELPKRKQIRLKDYDYSQNGYYFVTICAQNRQNIFGEIISEKINLNNYGKFALDEMLNVKTHYHNINIDKFVIMPNHIHCIIVVGAPLAAPELTITNNAGTGAASSAPTVGNIVRGYKSGVSRKCGFSVWQRGYYEHIIRNEQEYLKIYEYIENNPLKWQEDKYYV